MLNKPKPKEPSALAPPGTGSVNTSPIAPKSPRTPRTPFLHSRSPSLEANGDVLVKKRLVEQFYKMESHKGKPRADALGHAPAFSPLGQPVERTAEVARPERLTSKEIEDAIQRGNLPYVAPEAAIVCPENVAEAMINIDTAKDVDDLGRVVSILRSAAGALERKLAGFAFDGTFTLKGQLDKLSEYLRELQHTVDGLTSKVRGTTLDIKARYLKELEESGTKLENLKQLLDTLSTRLNNTRNSMADSKQVLTDTMAQKIKVLEYISARFDEYDQVNRLRRVRQLIVGLSVVVVAFCLFIAFRAVR